MSISYKIKKGIIRHRQRRTKKFQASVLKKLTIEEKSVFFKVKHFAITHNYEIRFDPYSDEILILLPKMLITLKDQTVFIDNTTGFLATPLFLDAYKMLVNIIKIEAHRERRKLKHEVKQRIRAFLNKIETGEPQVYSEFDEDLTEDYNQDS